MAYRWCGGITARRCYARRCTASAGWRNGSRAGTSSLEAFFGGARTVFNLATLEERRECYVHRATNPDHLIPSKPTPTNLPPLRVAARYAAGRPRSHGDAHGDGPAPGGGRIAGFTPAGDSASTDSGLGVDAAPVPHGAAGSRTLDKC